MLGGAQEAASPSEQAMQKGATQDARSGASDDDVLEFLELATAVLDSGDVITDDEAPVATSIDVRLRRYIGLGVATGLDTDPTGLYVDPCVGNGHDGGIINGFGYRDCGDPSPSD